MMKSLCSNYIIQTAKNCQNCRISRINKINLCVPVRNLTCFFYISFKVKLILIGGDISNDTLIIDLDFL